MITSYEAASGIDVLTSTFPVPTLSAFRPPVFDNPATTGFHDDKSGALFSSDCFGALLPAAPENAADLSDQELREGQVFWATLDSPWLHKVDGAAFAKELNGIRAMEPALVLSSHLPAAPGSMTQRLLASLEAAPPAHRLFGAAQR